MEPTVITRVLNSISGRSESGYPAIPDDVLWRIAAAYRFEAPTPMKQIYPPLVPGTYDAHLWADTKSEYSVRLSFRGGEPPFRVVKKQQPAWAQLGAGVEVQDFTRTPTAEPGLFEYTLPEKYMTVTGQAVAEGVYDFGYLIIDQTSAVLDISWRCTVTDSGRIKYLDAVNGNDLNAGTFEAPFQTFPKMWNLANADQFIFKLKPGAYAVSDGAAGNASFAAGKPKHISGLTATASLYVLDMANNVITGSGNNITLKNFRITGAPAAATNPRQVSFNGRVTELQMCNVEFDTRVGTSGNDNPCGVFFPDVGATKSKGIAIVDCKLLSTSTASLAVYFSVEDCIEENCTTSGIVFPQTNGSLVSHFKGRVVNCTQRFCSYSADSGNGLVWVSNQNPEDCANMELVCNTYTNVGTGNDYVTRFNGQVTAGTRPAGQLVQRCSIAANDKAPLTFETYVAGDDVAYSGVLWSSSTATVIDATGGAAIDPTSLKVADVSALSAPMVGIGARLLSTVVV